MFKGGGSRGGFKRGGFKGPGAQGPREGPREGGGPGGAQGGRALPSGVVNTPYLVYSLSLREGPQALRAPKALGMGPLRPAASPRNPRKPKKALCRAPQAW